MSKLSWGRPRIFTKDLDTENATWKEINTPVEDSTELQTTKGDKMEAPIEGGQNEDVKYKGSTYELVYNIRKYKGRSAPYATKDGVSTHHYSVALMPEDVTNIGFVIERTAVSVDDTFTAADGAIWNVQHDAIAAVTGNTVKWGTLSITEENKLSFTETQPAEGATAATFEESVTTLTT